MTQQAASARIRQAKNRLGVELARSGPTGTTLTQEGRLVVEWAAPVLEAARRLDLALISLRPGTDLVIAASQTIAEHLLPEWLGTLRRDREADAIPRLISGNSAGVLAAISAGTAQLGFIETPDVPTDLYRAQLGADKLAVVVSPTHPWATAGAVTAADLARTPLLLRERGSGSRRALERWLSQRNLRQAEPAGEFGTTSAILAAVRGGTGVAVVSRRAVQFNVERSTLAEIRTDAPIVRELTAVWTTPRLAPQLQRLRQIAQLDSDT
ncbi:LysR family transcriptional regulator [Curtobacterium sp. MCBD17_034]|nr:LysR family transcriptional regulator [Curtobacterium sp. MCBD17_034]PZM34118.1 LysR family transcriptional regulator [Curtobacterium sp. MCBD17_031]